MAIFLLIKVLLILVNCLSLNQALVASNAVNITGETPYVCAFFRAKDYSIDDLSMPEILTFCACTIIHAEFVITARLCYVQLDWYVAPINKIFTDKLPDNLHKIERVKDWEQLTLVKISPSYTGEVAKLAETALKKNKTCELYGFSTPDNKVVNGTPDNMIYKVWHMEGNLLKVQVEALYYEVCKARYNNYLSEYLTDIRINTLCINPLKNEYLEPCAFDRGAPIVCNGYLQGILIYQRPHPKGIPLHLPTGCYGNINNSISIYAESITAYHKFWLEETIKEYT